MALGMRSSKDRNPLWNSVMRKIASLPGSSQEHLSLLQPGNEIVMRIPSETFACRCLLEEERQGL